VKESWKLDLHSRCWRLIEIIRRKLGPGHLPGEALPILPSMAPGAKRVRLKILGLLAVLIIFPGAHVHPAMAGAQESGAPRVPYFSILANDGMTYTPDYLKGNVVLIMFWATWCPYCRKAMPHMNNLASEYANAEFTLLGVCGSKDTATWHDYIQQHQLQWPQYWDKDLGMEHLFGARGVPNFFLIDKDGYVVAHWVGWDDSLTGRVEKLIDHTLTQPRRQ
jgi:thiol-disulfide isomerase/thioredoxin